VLIQHTAEPQDGGLIGQAPHGRGQVCKQLAVQRNVVQCFLDGRIRQAKPPLQERNAQHSGHCKRRTSHLARGCLRTVQRDQSRP
jgi:hypothetical protein